MAVKRDPAIEEEFMKAMYRGSELLSSGQLKEALPFLEKAHSLNQRNEKAQNLLGLCNFKLGNLKRAAEVYELLVRDNPVDATLRVNLGLVYLKTNQLELCIKEFETATDLDSDHKKAHNYLGLALAQKGDYALAKEHFVIAGSDPMVEKMDKALKARADSRSSSAHLVPPVAPAKPEPSVASVVAPSPAPSVVPMNPALAGDWSNQLAPAENEKQATPEDDIRFAEDEGPPALQSSPSQASLQNTDETLPVIDGVVESDSAETPIEAEPVSGRPSIQLFESEDSNVTRERESGLHNESPEQPPETAAVIDTPAPPAPPDEGDELWSDDAKWNDDASGGVAREQPVAAFEVTAPVETEDVVAHAPIEQSAAALEIPEQNNWPVDASNSDENTSLQTTDETPAADVSAQWTDTEHVHSDFSQTVSEETPTENAVQTFNGESDYSGMMQAPENEQSPMSVVPTIVAEEASRYAPMHTKKLADLGAATNWVHRPEEGPFHLSPDGLAVTITTEMLVRMTGLVAMVGSVDVKPENKRRRGRSTNEPFGLGPWQMQRVSGHGVLYLEPGKSKFHALDLIDQAGVSFDDEGAYLREDMVFAFEEPLMFENGKLMQDNSAMELVHLKGQGRVLIQLDGELRAMPVPAGTPMVIPLARLVGWFGRLTPRMIGFGGQGAMELTGEGFALLGAPAERL
jgi:uncharacterized protein (AIM24 family)